MVDEGVEYLCAGRFGCFLAVVFINIFEEAVLVLQFKVVPVLPADKDARVAIFEFKIMHALEDFRERFAFLEIQSAVVAASWSRPAIDDRDQVWICAAHRPARTHGQAAVELAFDLADVERDCLSSWSAGQCYGHSEGAEGLLLPRLSSCCFHGRFHQYGVTGSSHLRV